MKKLILLLILIPVMNLFSQDSKLELLFRADEFVEAGGNLYGTGYEPLYESSGLALKVNPPAPFTLDLGGTAINNYLNLFDDGLTTQILVGGGAGVIPAWGTDLPTAITIGSAYIYRAGGTDVPDADVADNITIDNTSITTDTLINSGGGSFGDNVNITGIINADSLIDDGGGTFGNDVTVSGDISTDSLYSTNGAYFGNWVAIGGVATPLKMLHIAPNADASPTLVSAPGFYMYTGATNGQLSLANNNGVDGGFQFGTSVLYLGTWTGKDFIIRTNNTDMMRFVSGGNIQIGANGSTPDSKLVVEGAVNYYADTSGTDGNVNSLGINTNDFGTGELADGTMLQIKCNSANDGAVTLYVNAGTSGAIVKTGTNDLAAGDLATNWRILVSYDATNNRFQLMSPVAQ